MKWRENADIQLYINVILDYFPLLVFIFLGGFFYTACPRIDKYNEQKQLSYCEQLRKLTITHQDSLIVLNGTHSYCLAK